MIRSLFYEEVSIIINGMQVTAYSAQLLRRFRFQPHPMSSVQPQGITAPHTPKSTPCAIIEVACAVDPMPPLLLYAPSLSTAPADWLDFDGPDGPWSKER
jgi:hypothetical protein